MKRNRPQVNRHRKLWIRAVAFLVAVLVAGPLAASSGMLSPEGTAAGDQASVTVRHSDSSVATWPWQLRHGPTCGAACQPTRPHPAVARIIVPERDATAYGSGTLVDVRDEYGLVVTNWHVVRDSQGVVEVVFPDGFRSHARPLKVDSDWDLAALVIWRPPIQPVQLADRPPRPGDPLTIHGYGGGQYRVATGRCTSYYAPRIDFPQEMVELDVEARQGDSGGPIFNDRGQLAGVLFGAGQGSTIGSFGPRVQSFLASLAPDIGAADDRALVAVADRPAPQVHTITPSDAQAGGSAPADASTPAAVGWTPPVVQSKTTWPESGTRQPREEVRLAGTTTDAAAIASESLRWQDVAGSDWFERAKTLFALVGVVAVALQLVRVVR